MTKHTNSHEWERPAGQDEDTRRRTLALMFHRANALQPRTGTVRLALRGLYRAGLLVVSAGLLAIGWAALTTP